MPLVPIKQSISTGFMLLSGRPCCASHKLMSSLPYLSGSISANNPGSPLKASIDVLVFFLKDGNSKIAFSECMGICNGAKSQFSCLNVGSYSKVAIPVASFQATAPTSSPHIFTYAVFIFTNHFFHQRPFSCSLLFFFSLVLLWPALKG